MNRPDLNLLTVLDALLTEGSVAGAARRMRLSSSAMSRALTRLRETTGDPLLVRAGRRLVPTPRALELKPQVGRLVEEVEAVLRQQSVPDLRALDRTFSIRVRDGFAECYGAALLHRVAMEAPSVCLRFVQKGDKDSDPLRDGNVDMETGVIGPETGPEIRVQALFHDRFVGAVRRGHVLTTGSATIDRFLAGQHVAVSRRADFSGPIDRVLADRGQRRDVAAVVSEFSAALSIVRMTDLIAIVPEKHTVALREGIDVFDLPIKLPGITVSLLWHPRMDADPAHRWLRGCIRCVCAEV